MGKNVLSRRDFLKLSGYGLAALRFGPPLLALGLGTGACAPGFEPPGELQRKSFDKRTVIFNGKTVSVDEDRTESTLRQCEQPTN